MKRGALALALAVLALTVGAALLTMRSGGTTAARVIPKTATTTVRGPVKRVLGSKPRCQSDDEGGDKTGEDRSSKRCDSEAGDDRDSGGDNEPDEKDSGD
jgi:hypothetical protein